MNHTDAIRQWCTAFAPPLDLDVLVQMSLGSLLEVTGTDYGVVLLSDHSLADYVVHSARGLPEVVSLQRVQEKALAPLQQVSEPVLVASLSSRSAIRKAIQLVDEQLTQGATEFESRAVSLCLPLHGEEGLLGVILLGALEPEQSAKPLDLALVGAIASQLTSAYRNAAVHEQTCLSYHQVIEVFAECIDVKGPHPRGHSKCVSYYASLIGQQMGLSEPDLECLELAGYLHDVGMVFVPEAVLKKPGALTPEEYGTIQSSIRLGAELLEVIAGLTVVAEIVRHHTEAWDGSGYPDGLSGEAIPMGSRILRVATRFAAMLSQRTYRRAMTLVNGAMATISRESGASLDPAAVRALLSAMGRSA